MRHQQRSLVQTRRRHPDERNHSGIMDRRRFAAGRSTANQKGLAITAACRGNRMDLPEMRRKTGTAIHILLEMRHSQTLTQYFMPAPPSFPVIEQPKSKLTWYQYAWIGWPI